MPEPPGPPPSGHSAAWECLGVAPGKLEVARERQVLASLLRLPAPDNWKKINGWIDVF